MQFNMHFHYDNTEWLYAPGFVYHQYDDDVTRELSLIFLAGNSSGGHLALLTAFTKAHGKYIPEGLFDYTIAGVIGQAASSDLKLCQSNPWPAEWGKRPTTCLMGVDTDEECLEKADVAVCKNYVTSNVTLPPVLLLHFADDPIIFVLSTVLIRICASLYS